MAEVKTKTGCSEDTHCDYNNFKRTRYFHGMLMTERDFQEEQKYYIEKRKMLNRMLHGSGVVCGLKIKPTPTPGCKVIIEPGLAIDCCGNEIFVCEEYEFDASKIICAPPKTNSNCEEIETNNGIQKWYVIVRYKEAPTNPVSVYAPGGGCDEKVCDYSRIREGYCFELCRNVNCCSQASFNRVRVSGRSDNAADNKPCDDLLLPCSCDCGNDSCVVLGSIEFTLTNRTVSTNVIDASIIDNWDHRKYVFTFGLLQYWANHLITENTIDNGNIDFTCLADMAASLSFPQVVIDKINEQKDKTTQGNSQGTGISHAASEAVKNKVVEIVAANKNDGVTLKELAAKINLPEEKIKPILTELKKG